MYKIKWIFRMAWRDFRQSKSKLVLFASSIVIGIAALVAIISFGDNLSNDIDNQAKELLGADFVLSNNQPIEIDSLLALVDDSATEISFASMVAFPANEDSKLSQVRALQGDYPFFGSLSTSPEEARERFKTESGTALIERTLLIQLGAALDDTLKIGTEFFKIIGVLEKVPGQSGIVGTVAPSVYIPLQDLEKTGLVQYGSRLTYNYYFKISNEKLVEELIETKKKEWEDNNIRYETPEIRKRSTGRAFGNLANFLSLVAFIALLLGSVGVASSVNVFIKEKISSVAILRCLGMSISTAIWIYLLEIVVMALFGSLSGALAGTALQYLLPSVFAEFLPLEVSFTFSFKAIGIGILTGVLIAVLFALLPLLRIRKASPMMTLRPSMEPEKLSADPYRYLVLTGILLFILGFSYFLLESWKLSLGFTGFVIGAFTILWAVGKSLMVILKRTIPISLSYPIRQSLANLHRPNNQTISLISTIGLGTAMISTLFFLQNILLSEVKLADRDNQPNMLLFDIQTDQVSDVRKDMENLGLPILQEVPIVTMRLQKINGIDKSSNEGLDDETRRSRSLYNREFRVTYRDTLISSEKLVHGNLKPVRQSSDSLFVSMDRDYSDRVGIKMGDELVFNVQGRPLTTYVGSMRDVNYNQVSTNFLVIFPENVLEKAPKFHVIISKSKDEIESAEAQRHLVGKYPNISMINLTMIVETLEDILGKISFVIQFMALFSILTGLLVLISSLIISKYQRQKESILLRTIGAKSRLVNQINILEYGFLGILAAGSGILLSFIATWLLSAFVFEISFSPPWFAAFLIFVIVTVIIVFLGITNSRSILKSPIRDILREN